MFNKLKVIQFLFFSLLILSVLFITTCDKLDDDGGYYDEKTGLYKYVFPNRTNSKWTSELKVKTFRPGVVQQIQGVITDFDPNLKTIWLQIDNRQVYMILAEGLAKGNRDDKDRKIRIDLSYVSPALISSKSQSFKKQWRDYLKKLFKVELVNQRVVVDVEYQERSKKLWGVVFKVTKSKDTAYLRNVNKWMIINGLSYYIIDQGPAAKDDEYLKAQNLAIKNKSGLWKYK